MASGPASPTSPSVGLVTIPPFANPCAARRSPKPRFPSTTSFSTSSVISARAIPKALATWPCRSLKTSIAPATVVRPVPMLKLRCPEPTLSIICLPLVFWNSVSNSDPPSANAAVFWSVVIFIKPTPASIASFQDILADSAAADAAPATRPNSEITLPIALRPTCSIRPIVSPYRTPATARSSAILAVLTPCWTANVSTTSAKSI